MKDRKKLWIFDVSFLLSETYQISISQPQRELIISRLCTIAYVANYLPHPNIAAP